MTRAEMLRYAAEGEAFLRQTEGAATVAPDYARRVVATLVDAMRAAAGEEP